MGWPKSFFHLLRAAAMCVLVMLCAHVAVSQEAVEDGADVGESVEETAPVAGYKATIQSDNVYLRSGPSFGHYPTEKLTRGKTVEVYRTAPGGWVGVRPLESSYCWLPASAVELDAEDETIGHVIDQPVEAWIGSNVERVKRHESQVVLEPGEEVVILGERAREGDEPWYKIAPPRGEFRWVHSKHLSNKSPKQLAADDARKEVNRAKQLIETGIAPNTTELPVSNWHDRKSERQPKPKADADVAGENDRPRDEQQYIEDEALEQAAFGDRLKKAGGRIRNSYLGQRIFGRNATPEENGGEFDISGGGASIGASSSGSGEEIAIGSGGGREDELPIGDNSPRESTYGKDETRPYPSWAKRRFGDLEPQRGAEDQADGGARIDLSPAGKKKQPDGMATQQKQTGSSLERNDRSAPRDRSKSDRPADRMAGHREFNGYDDDEALTVSPAIERGLEDLDRELTVMAGRDPSKWNMGALREYGEKLLSRSRTPLERGRVRLLLDRIAAFESTAPTSGTWNDWEAPATRPDGNVATLPDRTTPRSPNTPGATGDIFQPPQTSPRKNSPSQTPTFDGVGHLMPVLDNQRKGLPPYQLVDDDGNLLRYVTPEPGVNLRRYERKQVGLYGLRGYIEALGKDHLTARRVVDLDQIRR